MASLHLTTRSHRRARYMSGKLFSALALLLFFDAALSEHPLFSHSGSQLVAINPKNDERLSLTMTKQLEVEGFGSWRLPRPGSLPPSCRSRCGGCVPCRPVHVAIRPGRSVPLEYYPEAWRCRCGSKLFMP
ncbi:hypothetical protein HPP92_026406 [Vanilla planifolia]|uniref:Epidermal patterning factor-like protein n=1 Tax=Vanilla planifolia TaxID=51239 RepID=A0A835U7A9_VANPL|nr:hypothetical protein HPP92_026406 [Vanilla planifolia]KAG0455557.1 hypothetical protein HPP92_024849 [Vanilla planifolia]